MEPKASSLYSELGGFDTILALTHRWHERRLQNPDTSHPFEHDLHPYHAERLAAYLAEAFGGPALYSAGYGDESHVQRLHACNGVHVELDEACVMEFDAALSDIGVEASSAAKASAYFRQATERQRGFSQPDAVVPDGLPFGYA